MPMKRKAEPASLEEEVKDTTSGDILRRAAASASITSRSDQPERRKEWRRSGLDFQSGAAAKYLGSMLEVIYQATEGNFLTVLAGEHEDNVEVWQECARSGRKYRTYYHEDAVINGEFKTYIDRKILISTEGGDLERMDQEIIIAQRTYSSNGKVELKAHSLCFQGRIDLDRPYIFPKLGDEILGVGCPDLHCTFRGIRDWQTVLRSAQFTNCDSIVNINITKADIRNQKKLVFDLDRDRVVGTNENFTHGISISCGDFELWGGNSATTAYEATNAYPSPPSNKRRKHDTLPVQRNDCYQTSNTIGVKLIGMGPVIEGALRADLNINLVLGD